MKYQDFITRFPRFRKLGGRVEGILTNCPAHEDGTASLQICRGNDERVLITCHAGCSTESVVSSLGLKMGDLFPDRENRPFIVPKSTSAATTVKPEIECVYPYLNHSGNEVYQAVRLQPKSFRQRHLVDGKWVWSMDGVERVLYHLPEVLQSQEVWICEGEKDADNLVALGYCATCNVGGAGKWLDGYTETLVGKDVVICGDSDDPGKKHVELVFDSICGKVKTVRIIKLPEGIKDVSDYISTFKDPSGPKRALDDIKNSAHPFVKGIKLPIYSMSEMEGKYKAHVRRASELKLDLGKWIPTFGRHIRPLVEGELVFVLGDVGGGKTAVLQQIAEVSRPLPTIMFELELPEELLFERFLAHKSKLTCSQIETGYLSGDSLGAGLDSAFKNLFVCPESKLTLEDIERYIMRGELKLGERPRLILIDYIQLMQGMGDNRRERVSDIAEGLKVLAKSTRTIIICSSQVQRPTEGNRKIGLHSGKESGSIEASCGLLLGLWRDEEDPTLMHLKVLKSTKGGAGLEVLCNFDGARMTITERSQFAGSDVPNTQSKDP
jgi:hypothetical protein